MIFEQRLDKNHDTIAAFIDLEKTFDMVNWLFLLDCMRIVGIDW